MYTITLPAEADRAEIEAAVEYFMLTEPGMGTLDIEYEEGDCLTVDGANPYTEIALYNACRDVIDGDRYND
jgi:hypothetical protein